MSADTVCPLGGIGANGGCYPVNPPADTTPTTLSYEDQAVANQLVLTGPADQVCMTCTADRVFVPEPVEARVGAASSVGAAFDPGGVVLPSTGAPVVPQVGLAFALVVGGLSVLRVARRVAL